MSKIEITSNNIDKFVKRFHKVSDAKNNGKKLSESQETFAQSLGCSNYNELKKLLENETIKPDIKKDSTTSNIEYKGLLIENFDNMTLNEILSKFSELSKISNMNKVEFFYAKILTLVHHRYSKISSCIFEKDGFEYSITFRTCYGDKFCFIFGRELKSSLSTALKSTGFSDVDVLLISAVLSDSTDNQFDLKDRFQSIDFANNLYNYLCEIRGEKKLYVLKFNEKDIVNKDYVYKHDLLYKKETNYIKKPEFKEFTSALLDHKDNEYFYLKSKYLLQSWSYGSTPFNYLESLSNDDIILEKADINKIKIEY
jgi:hypothetical protein